jgi:hypothetical protein
MGIQSEIEAAERQDDLEKWEAYRQESIEKRAKQGAEQEINRRNSPTPAPYGVAKESPVLTTEAREAVYKKHEHNAAIELKPWFDNPKNKEKFIEDLKQKREAELAQSTQQEKAAEQVREVSALQPMHPDDYRALQEERVAAEQQEITQPMQMTPESIDLAGKQAIEQWERSQEQGLEYGLGLGLGHEF